MKHHARTYRFKYYAKGDTLLRKWGKTRIWQWHADIYGVRRQIGGISSLQFARVRLDILIVLLLLLGLLFSNWNTVAQIVPPKKILHTEYAVHIHPQPSLPTPNRIFAARTIYTTQVSSQIDRLLTQKVYHQQFSGSVLISRSNHIILQKGYSMASWQRRQPNTVNTRFYLGSTSKQFTAMAILLLHEQKKLHLHSPICAYVSPCPASWQPVTLHEILMHTSGIPLIDDEDLPTTSLQAWINGFAGVPLLFTPGSQYRYCSVCYQILGYVVELVSHLPFCTFLQQKIFAPLQMKDTGCNPHYTAVPTYADGYDDWQNEDLSSELDVDPQWSFLFGSGLLYSTVSDMYRWDMALMHQNLLSPYLQQAAFTPYTSSQYAGSRYGYGWFIAHGPGAGHRLIWHNGKISGFRTYNGLYPDDHVTLIILSNLTTLDEIALAHEIQQIIFAYPWS